MSKEQILLRTLLLLAVVVLANFLAVRFFKRLDLTENKIYTLSDVSKRLMNSLDDKLQFNQAVRVCDCCAASGGKSILKDERIPEKIGMTLIRKIRIARTETAIKMQG